MTEMHSDVYGVPSEADGGQPPKRRPNCLPLAGLLSLAAGIGAVAGALWSYVAAIVFGAVALALLVMIFVKRRQPDEAPETPKNAGEPTQWSKDSP